VESERSKLWEWKATAREVLGRLRQPMPAYAVLGLLLFSSIPWLLPQLRNQLLDDGTAADSTQGGFGVDSLIREVKLELTRAEETMERRNESAMFRVKGFDLELNFVIARSRGAGVTVGKSMLVADTKTSVDATRIQKLYLHMEMVPPETVQVGVNKNLWNERQQPR